MIVAVLAVGMMQPAVHQIIHVRSVRNGWMSTVGTMHMGGRMTLRAVCALIRVRRVHPDHMLVHMVPVRMMEVPFVEIIRVAFVLNRSMSATGPMLVGVIRMFRAIAHMDSFRLRSFVSSITIVNNLAHTVVFRKRSCLQKAVHRSQGRSRFYLQLGGPCARIYCK